MSAALDTVTSIKTKLGLLVAVSVVVAALLATIGALGGVPALLSIPVTVALALGVTQLLAAGMVAPLRQMTTVAQQMARGDYSGRVHTSATDEVGRLAATFNQMAADLADVDAERRDLISTVSHELRTPLAAMTAVLENLADGVVPADGPHLQAALAQAERLRSLVADLLTLSRVEAGVAALDLQEIPAAEIVAAAVDEVTTAGARAAYVVDIAPDVVFHADPDRLRQVLVNALDNAARHSPPDAPVTVTAGAAPEGWWLEVHDLGPGVAPIDRERVFERFGTDAGGGTGVGLAVARWIATLHGGTLRFLDPTDDHGLARGARLRLDVPTPNPPTDDEEVAMSSTPTGTSAATLDPAGTQPTTAGAPTAPPVGPPPGMDALFGRFWPERARDGSLRVVLTSAAVGVLAGATMTFAGPGLAWSLVLLAAGFAALATARHRRNPLVLAASGLGILLVTPLALLDDAGIALLCALAGMALFLAAVARATTAASFLLAWLAWPLAAVRGLPWLGRSLRVGGLGDRRAAVVRTALVSLLALGVFGALFASADALFASWVDAVVPNLTLGSLIARGFVACAVFGLSLAASYAALNPARVDLVDKPAVPLGNRFEWLVPVLLVDLVFGVFLAAQATAFFGGHDYLEQTTGLTYADYVHQGFGQLTIATVLTLLVVWAAARRAGATRRDRLWLRASLGLLCVLALVVVASALYRMHLYQEAYGFTVLRLTVDVFEGWLGLVIVVVMALGVTGHARWVPRIALTLGAIATLTLAAINPDAWVADRNIDRYEETGVLDVYYLQSLSADAAPVIRERLPEDIATCALQYLPLNQLDTDRGGLWDWNLGRQRAKDAIAGLDLTTSEERGQLDGDPCTPIYDELSAAQDRTVG